MKYGRRYASRTGVSTDKSQAEIQKILRRYEATGFALAWQGGKAVILFEMKKRQIKFVLPLPDKEDYAVSDAGRPRSHEAHEKAYELASRQRWRALALSMKAKLETVESGIAVFEEEFLAYMVIPGSGKTYGEMAVPQIDDVYAQKALPPLIGFNHDKK